ncbi:hypothetical protein V8E54_012249 [Elaphomyces granulatus]
MPRFRTNDGRYIHVSLGDIFKSDRTLREEREAFAALRRERATKNVGDGKTGAVESSSKQTIESTQSGKEAENRDGAKAIAGDNPVNASPHPRESPDSVEEDAHLRELKNTNCAWKTISSTMGNKPIPELKRRWAHIKPTAAGPQQGGISANRETGINIGNGLSKRGRQDVNDDKEGLDSTASIAVPRIWTPGQDTYLRELKTADNTWKAISYAMGHRPIPELKKRWAQIKVAPMESKQQTIAQDKVQQESGKRGKRYNDKDMKGAETDWENKNTQRDNAGRNTAVDQNEEPKTKDNCSRNLEAKDGRNDNRKTTDDGGMGWKAADGQNGDWGATNDQNEDWGATNDENQDWGATNDQNQDWGATNDQNKDRKATDNWDTDWKAADNQNKDGEKNDNWSTNWKTTDDRNEDWGATNDQNEDWKATDNWSTDWNAVDGQNQPPEKNGNWSTNRKTSDDRNEDWGDQNEEWKATDNWSTDWNGPDEATDGNCDNHHQGNNHHTDETIHDSRTNHQKHTSQQKRGVSFADPLVIPGKTGGEPDEKNESSQKPIRIDNEFTIEELLLLHKLADRYEREKWLRISSRFFDKTGRRITPEKARIVTRVAPSRKTT